MKKVLSIIIMTTMLLTMFTFTAFAANTPISGKVTKGDGTALQGVALTMYDPADTDYSNPLGSTTSASNGTYTITPSGTQLTKYIIKAVMSGYLTRYQFIKFLNGVPYFTNIWMESTTRAVAIIDINTNTNKTALSLNAGFCDATNGITHRYNEPALVTATDGTGAQVLRFPEGTLGNFYDWQSDDFLAEDAMSTDGTTIISAKYSHPNEYAHPIVDRNNYSTDADYQAALTDYANYINHNNNIIQNIRTNHAAWGGKYGLNDFLDACSQMNSGAMKRMYTLNLCVAPGLTDPVDHAVAWIQDAKNKGTLPDFAELGNEIHNVQGAISGIDRLDRYLSLSDEAGTAIKGITSTTKVGIVANASYKDTGAAFTDSDNSNKAIAAYPNQSFYDALIIHPYVQYIRVAKNKVPNIDDGPRAYPNIRDELMATTQTVPGDVTNYLKNTIPGKNIWVTETGCTDGESTVVDGNGKPLYNLNNTVLNAMAETDYLLHWMDNDTTVKNYVKYHLVSGRGDDQSAVMFYNPDNGQIVKHATYYAYSFLENAMRNIQYRCTQTVTGQDYFPAVPNENGLLGGYPGGGATVSVEELTTRAFLGKDGTTKYLAFVNKSDLSKTIRIKINGYRPTKTAEVQYITGSLDARNTKTDPTLVVPQIFSQSTLSDITLPSNSTGIIRVY